MTHLIVANFTLICASFIHKIRESSASTACSVSAKSVRICRNIYLRFSFVFAFLLYCRHMCVAV